MRNIPGWAAVTDTACPVCGNTTGIRVQGFNHAGFDRVWCAAYEDDGRGEVGCDFQAHQCDWDALLEMRRERDELKTLVVDFFETNAADNGLIIQLMDRHEKYDDDNPEHQAIRDACTDAHNALEAKADEIIKARELAEESPQ